MGPVLVGVSRHVAIALFCLGACASRHRVVPENRVSCAGPHTLSDTANGRLQGTATDADSDVPVPGVDVSVSSPGHNRSTVTDDRGGWLLGDLPEGRYNVVLHREGRVLYSHVVHLCPEDVITLRTPLREARR